MLPSWLRRWRAEWEGLLAAPTRIEWSRWWPTSAQDIRPMVTRNWPLPATGQFWTWALSQTHWSLLLVPERGPGVPARPCELHAKRHCFKQLSLWQFAELGNQYSIYPLEKMQRLHFSFSRLQLALLHGCQSSRNLDLFCLRTSSSL